MYIIFKRKTNVVKTNNNCPRKNIINYPPAFFKKFILTGTIIIARTKIDLHLKTGIYIGISEPWRLVRLSRNDFYYCRILIAFN